MSTTVPALTLRTEKGSPLTSAEGDHNLVILRDAINGAFALLAVALKSDGTLKDNAVATLAIIDRAVTNAKLAFGYAFYAADTGTADHLVVAYTPAPTAWVQGMVLFVRVANTNAGPTGITLTGIVGEKSIRKNGTEELVPGDIVVGQIIELLYDPVSANVQLINTVPQLNTPWNTGVVPQQATPVTTGLTSAVIPFAGVLSDIQEVAQAELVLPDGMQWVWVRVVFGGILFYTGSNTAGVIFEDNPVRHDGNSLSLSHDAPKNGLWLSTGSFELPFGFVAEGVPTGYETVTLNLEVRAAYISVAPQSAAQGDVSTRRRMYAVGYYKPA